MTPEQKLKELAAEFPAPPTPVGAYVPGIRTGNLIFTAGQIPMREGKLLMTGKVAIDVPIKSAQACARQCALNALSIVRSLVGSLDQVVRIVRVNVFVNSAPGFFEQAAVANGASEVLVDIFGDAGRHTRCAIGAAELPLNAPVEVDLVVEVK